MGILPFGSSLIGLVSSLSNKHGPKASKKMDDNARGNALILSLYVAAFILLFYMVITSEDL